MKKIYIATYICFAFILVLVGVRYQNNNPHCVAQLTDVLPENASPFPVAVITPEPPPLSEQIAFTIRGELHPGDSLSKALKRVDVPIDIRRQIIKILSSCLDFRNLRPKDHFTIDLNDNQEMIRCAYEADPLHRYTIVKRDNVYVATQDDIPLEVKTVSLSGSIQGALFRSFAKYHVSPRLIYSFADIFSSRIDFNTESQPGDTFSIVYEEYSRSSKFVGYGNILYAQYGQPSLNVNYEVFYYKDANGHGAHYTPDGKDIGSIFIRSPLPMGRLTSKFSYHRKHPILGTIRPHLGIDLAAPIGTPVMAAADGKVVFRGVRGGFGKQIILKHGNGYKTYYGHLSRFGKGLCNGSKVSQKDIIGYVGSTGLSTGPHLDYRIAQNGIFMNPFGMAFTPKTVLNDDEFIKFSNEFTSLMAILSTKERILYVHSLILTPQDTLTLL